MAIGGFGNLQLDKDVGTGLGSFMKGYRDASDLITGIRMNRERGNLASALESGDYNKASQIAMNAGDAESALQFAELQNRKEANEENAKNRATMLGIQLAGITQEQQDKINKQLEEQQKKEADTAYANFAANKALDLIEQHPNASTLFSINTGYNTPENRKANAEINQLLTTMAGQLTNIQKQGGAAASMMNSDREGSRMLGIFADPSSATSSEKASAIKWAQKYINFKGSGELPQEAMENPSILQGYEEYQQSKGNASSGKYTVREIK